MSVRSDTQRPEDSFGTNGKCPKYGTTFAIMAGPLCAECRAGHNFDADANFTCHCKERGCCRTFVGPADSTWTNSTRRPRQQICEKQGGRMEGRLDDFVFSGGSFLATLETHLTS